MLMLNELADRVAPSWSCISLHAFFLHCRKMGVAVKLLTPSQLQDMYPWMNTTGIGLATVGKYVLQTW